MWMSTRIFTNTGGAPQQAAWTTPSVVTDTADIDFEFSAAASNPGNPTSSPKLWHNTATSDDVWMAVRKKSNGVWGAWEVSKIKGDKGEDGKSFYTWIKYADNADGDGISDNPVAADGTLKKYIGFAYNKTTPTESNVASDYTWALFKGTDGTDGIPGKPGANGTTYYTWIKYADALGSNGYPTEMYDTARATTEYIGIAVNQTERAEGTDPTAYSWSKFKGEKGEDGADGADGKGIVSQVDYYAVSASKTDVPDEWIPNTPPSMTSTLRYLWKYTLTTFTDGSTEQTTPCVVGVFGVDGLSYRYSKWVAGVEYRNDNNPYYRDGNGQGIIDVVYTDAITIYDPYSNATPPAGYICRKTHRSNGTIEFASDDDWAQSGNTFTSNKIKASTSTWAKIIFRTYVANTVITVKITASSEANYDWGYVCGLDKAYSTSDYLARVSGTNSRTVEITVPTMGVHYFYVGYTKDGSRDQNNDNAVVNIVSVTPAPVPLETGENWTRMNSMAPILSALVIADRIKANYIDVENLAANTAFIDSLTVNKLVAGVQDGQRVEITPDNKSVNIYDADGTLASTFEGNKYTNISSLFSSVTSGTITVTEESGTKRMEEAGIFSSSTPITSATQLLTSTKITVGGGTFSIIPFITKMGGTYVTLIELYLCTYSNANCTDKIQSSSLYRLLANSEFSTNTQTVTFSNKTGVVPAGWTRLEIKVNSIQNGLPTLICLWTDITDVTYTSDFYVSRYFANGLCLGRNLNNYIAIYNRGLKSGMNCSMVNGAYTFDFDDDGIFFKRSATEERKRLAPRYGLPFAALAVGTMLLNSKSPSMGNYRTVNGNNTGMSVSYQSDGTFKVGIPSSWGSTYVVQLTTLGRTDSNNPMGASVSSISTGSFIVDTMSLKGTWVNEAKVMFIITNLYDFNE